MPGPSRRPRYVLRYTAATLRLVESRVKAAPLIVGALNGCSESHCASLNQLGNRGVLKRPVSAGYRGAKMAPRSPKVGVYQRGQKERLADWGTSLQKPWLDGPGRARPSALSQERPRGGGRGQCGKELTIFTLPWLLHAPARRAWVYD